MERKFGRHIRNQSYGAYTSQARASSRESRRETPRETDAAGTHNAKILFLSCTLTEATSPQPLFSDFS